MRYLLDANVLISAHRSHYGFDFCPGFWDWLLAAHALGQVYSVARVEAELLGSGDRLTEWVKALPRGFFVAESSEDANAFRAVATWAQQQSYQANAINEFLQSADSALVAQAQARGDTVVTHEVRSQSLRMIKIPDACVGATVPYLTPYAMLRREQARFVLEKASP